MELQVTIDVFDDYIQVVGKKSSYLIKTIMNQIIKSYKDFFNVEVKYISDDNYQIITIVLADINVNLVGYSNYPSINRLINVVGQFSNTGITIKVQDYLTKEFEE
jgi:hypothetical protein